MKLVLSTILLLASAVVGLSQSTSNILKQAEKALGGSKALKAVRSVRKTGMITRKSDGAHGKYLYETAQPNLFKVGFDLDGFETEGAFNGRSGWSRNSRDGVETLTGMASTDQQAKAAFRNSLWLNYKTDKSKVTPAGQMTIDGKPSNGVLLTTQKGTTIKMYFDAATSLLVRDEIRQGDHVGICEYGDYRDVDGVKQAFSMRVLNRDEVYEIAFNDVKTNQTIPRSDFDYPVDRKAPLPDIQSLFKDLQANEDRLDSILDTYSYTQKTSTRELGKDGQLRETESETVQLSFYKGFRITRVIEKDGKPLTADEQAKEDKDAAKQVEEIEKRIAKNESRLGKQESSGAPSQDSRRISIAEMLRASKLLNPRRERFRGRDCVVFDFEPNPDFDLSSARSQLKLFGKTAGVMWIDEKDKQVARLQAVLYDSYKVGGGVLAKISKGAAFTLEKERVNDEIWLPSQMDINFAVRVLLFKGLNINQLITSYDYHKFETEVKGAKVGEDKP
ncbi:MAG TPA: hypothetical protein VGO43_10920 [Pyrinomonadaceae bacterium]|jgi:hypothetical protein|nr:hypothetical protein [Pyrinomonadaceae bacterium]